jgi:hypothetical protein
MTKAARWVLGDCKHALAHHSNDLQGEDFRTSWVAVVTLLRAVGHVLVKVDAKSNPRIAKVVKEEWDKLRVTKPEPRILWEFIEQERNNVVKLYQIGVNRGIRIKGPQIGGEETFIEADHAKSRGSRGFSPGAEFFSYIRSGSFAGRPECEVAREAIKFWEDFLDGIDKIVTAAGL